MATPRDVQEIVSRLSSNKAKTREEGAKLLNSWLVGERSFSFCKLLGQNTSRIRHDEIAHAETWPFLVTLLTKCIVLEKNASKKNPPKLMWAKMLRTVVQQAEDLKFSGKKLLLHSVVRLIFNHAWEIIKDVPSFQQEYGIILRHLLSVKEYRYQMRKRIYSGLILLYMKKIEELFVEESKLHPSMKEEAFRCILTLHGLLENPPGDFPSSIREDAVKGFVNIFSQIREEGKIARKLMACINTFLLKDGPNLGSQAMKIHSSVRDFIFRYWLLTHDRGLKNAFVLYSKIQLKLARKGENGFLIEQLLEVIGKEFDLCGVSGGMNWSESTRDDRVGTKSSLQSLMELFAIVFYQACRSSVKIPAHDKRQKRPDAVDRLRDGLMRGNWLWSGAFYFLVRHYGLYIEEYLLTYLFKGICESFERILINSYGTHSYDGILWILWALQDLCLVLSRSRLVKCSSPALYEVRQGWNTVWISLMHGLPTFGNVAQVADAALILLGNIISEDQISMPIVPQEVWEVQLFKHTPSVWALYFIACYFSKNGVQGNLRDVQYLRKSLLKVLLQPINSKEPNYLNRQMAMILPAAVFSLCVGYCPFMPTSMFRMLIEEGSKFLGHNEIEEFEEFEEFSVEVLAKIEGGTSTEMQKQDDCPSIRLSRDLREQLIREMGQYCASTNFDQETEGKSLSDISLFCLFLCNLIYGMNLTRLSNEEPLLFSKVLECIIKLLKLVISTVEEKHNDLCERGYLSVASFTELSGYAFSSLSSLIQGPLFHVFGEFVETLGESHENIRQLIEKLLNVMNNLIKDFLVLTSEDDLKEETNALSPSTFNALQHSTSMAIKGMKIVDMELDADDGPKDDEPSSVEGDSISATSYSVLQWKLDLISCVSSFSIILPAATQEVMVNLLEIASDAKVSEYLLLNICKSFPLSNGILSALVVSMNKMMDPGPNCSICYHTILTAIRSFLGSVSSKNRNSSHYPLHPSRLNISLQAAVKGLDNLELQNLILLGALVHKVGDTDIPDWSARVELIECICGLISLYPSIGQEMIPRLLALLQDSDYRVRLLLARRIGILFQTWDGHEELLQDICSNFGILLVMASEHKLVKVGEVLAAGSQSPMHLETALITLAHLAFYSDKVELRAVFMACANAAINPSQRDLVNSLLDNLSTQLGYSCRNKYFGLLIGPLLSLWITCELSLASLVEVRDIFVMKAEPKAFIQFCCPWLITLLLIQDDLPNLNFISSVSGQPLAVLLRKHFVHVFSICIALRSSTNSYKEAGDYVLSHSILHVAEISGHERDNLVKKHMVSIVSCLLSLTFLGEDPPLPFFPTETIASAIQTVVDGFLDIKDSKSADVIVDKLNVFRQDRVFRFLLEIHYQMKNAAHHRHKCHALAGVGVLVKIVGERATVSSTSLYIFNLVGQCITDPALQDQCCDIMLMILSVFQHSSTNVDVNVLGEQLQFLVSKLVICCIPDETRGAANHPSPKIFELLHQLTVDADKSLYDYIRGLEPFPDLSCFKGIKIFHSELFKVTCPRDHFLKFVKKIAYLPQALIIRSLRSLTENLEIRKTIQPHINTHGTVKELNLWNYDPELVSGVWALLEICGPNDLKEIKALVAGFISGVGIGDPHRIVFHLPGDAALDGHFPQYRDNSLGEESIRSHLGVSEKMLVNIIILLKKYLLDDDVAVVDVTSRTLQGVLSTEMGQRALFGFNGYEKSLLAVHSKGVNSELVEKLNSDSKRNSTEDISTASFWRTHSKSYETWICPLVHALICFTGDIILSLCQDIVLLKVEMAELLLPSVLVNISGRNDSVIDICQIISMKVEENIFLVSNIALKSVQIFLNALNVLRSYQNAGISHSYQRASKNGRHSAPTTRCAPVLLSRPLWKKVYWLSIDYLVVAKAAIQCGSYFTAVMYVEYWCEEKFNYLTLGSPDFSDLESLPSHIELLISAVTQINEPDSIYGIIQTYKVSSQIVTFEHEGNWSKALEYYDLLIRKASAGKLDDVARESGTDYAQETSQETCPREVNEAGVWKLHKGLMRSLQQIGCSHLLDVYFQGLSNQKCYLLSDMDFTELQYEAAWRSGNWDFSLLHLDINATNHGNVSHKGHFHEKLHSCLRALHDGDPDEFHVNLTNAKEELVKSICTASKESTGFMNSMIVKLQILEHLGMAWNFRWKPYTFGSGSMKSQIVSRKAFSGPDIPTAAQLECMNNDWKVILKQTQLHLDLLEPFISFRHGLLQILKCKECTAEHLLEAASILRKGSRFSLASAAMHEFKVLYSEDEREKNSYIFSLGRMKQMVDIYIKLAEIETKKEETNRRIPLPRDIRSIRHLELVPVVTATFPVDLSCQYSEGSFPHFKGLGDSIMVMNGINAPKVVECLGSDGCKYRQLAKSGNDDLRQDAVMEQFFGLVNSFLQGNRDTWKRRLKIRTYKVVPFTPSAGVLEWVNQTVPLGEYLIGSLRNGGAHARYGKGDWSFMQCREHMTNEKDKRKAFLRVCENFRPVMHYFFLERFLQPSDWFEKRLFYTRSVAASSMVGYIVGLGDRHSMNILIDQSSAEVIHIDLGVAFEQGLMLKTPERVPFRLTRDIIDGMGVTGVEGVFRRCCEETLSVMRTNKEALLTIVEVFIHDPLYKWALSPLKALQRQKETDEDAESSLEDSQDGWEGNKDAARALFRVKQKLDGYEDAEMRSVQGQVQQLIQDAIDTERLCQMFPGWGAWL